MNTKILDSSAPALPETTVAAPGPVTGAIIPAKSASPESMVDRINGLYRLVNEHVRTSVETGLELGRTLCECRQSIGHGNGQTWIATNLTFSYKTARRYERLWSRRDDVAKLIEKGHVSLLESTSLTAVYRHLEIITRQEEEKEESIQDRDRDEPVHDALPLDAPGCDNAEKVERESVDAEPGEEEAEGPDSQLSTTQESPTPEPPPEDENPVDSQKIPEANIERLAYKIWKGAIHYAPSQELDVARSLLKLILRKFPELKGAK